MKSSNSLAKFGGVLCALVFVVTCSACSSPDAVSDATANALRTQGGAADSSAGNGAVRFGAAASYMGDAENVHAEVSRTVSNSAAGDVQMAFNFAGVVNAQEAFQKAQETDPVVVQIRRRIERLEATSPVDEAAVAAATNELAVRLKDLQTGLASAGGSLPNLTHLTVVNIKRSANGADLPQIGAEEASEVPAGLKALRGD